jgi:hypothetical protein
MFFMTFRSTHGLLFTACAVLVPLALSCSSSKGSGDETQGPPAYSGSGSPSGTTTAAPPAPTDVTAQPSAGSTSDPGNNSEEGVSTSVPLAQQPDAPSAGTGTDPVTDTTTPVTTPPVTAPPVTTPQLPVLAGGYPENTGAGCTVSAGQQVRNTDLPNPFKNHDGTIISSVADWECRRNEIKKDIETFEIGAKPEPSTSTVTATLNGNNLSVVVKTDAGSLTLTSAVTRAAGAGPHCLGIGMDNASSLIKGCTLITFNASQVVTVNQNGMVSQADAFYKIYPQLWQKIANYSAWSWGVSRLIDGVDQLKDQLNVDMSKIAVHGCSYAGKMALFAGAFDERVALTLAQESGGGGINSWRLSQNFTTRTGTQVEKIDNTNYSWFLPSMQRLDPNTLPHDHHELVAMVAPRAFVTFGNRNYEWLGDESGDKSVVAAQQVWKALGAPDGTFGYDFTTDHTHCTAAQSQVNTATAFVNKFLLGQNDNTSIAIATDPQPHMAGQAVFDLDETKVVDWQAPTLQ